MKVIPICVSFGVLAAAFYFSASLVPNGYTPQVSKVSEDLAYQRQEWNKVELRHIKIVESCGDLASQGTSLQQQRTLFDRYQNGTVAFLEIVTQRMPNALRSRSCTDFVRNHQLAVSQSTSISTSLSILLRALSEDLISGKQRHEIHKASASATSQFTSRAQRLLRSLRSRLLRSALPIWSPYMSGEEPERIHDESGVAMLTLRSCVYNTRAMDKELEPLLKSVGQTQVLHSDFVAESITSSKAWESSEGKDGPSCTQQRLDTMGHHYQSIMNIISPEK